MKIELSNEITKEKPTHLNLPITCRKEAITTSANFSCGNKINATKKQSSTNKKYQWNQELRVLIKVDENLTEG